MSDRTPNLDRTPAVERGRSRRVLIGIIVVTAVLAIAVWAVLISLFKGQDPTSLIAGLSTVSPVKTLAGAVEVAVVSTMAETATPTQQVMATLTPAATLTPVPTATATRSPSDTPMPTNSPIPTDAPMPTSTLAPSDTPAPAATTSPTAIVAAFSVEVDALNVRGGPGVGYPILGQVKRGESFPISGRSESPLWWEFDYPDMDGATRKGWVSGELVSANVPAEEVGLAAVIPPLPEPVATPAPLVPTAAPAGAYNQPGFYPFVDHCHWAPLPSGSHVMFCVEGVEVRENGYMQFNVGWTAQMVNRGNWVDKGSDAGNRNMYLTDNLGNRYDHVETSGAAADAVRIPHGETARGWFLFLPAHSAATSFVFHDDDQGLVIGDIVLAK
jgi:uncharacterized protein YgiM (DUF1202 family)